MNKIKLFCFPYAGGSATIYSSWKKYIAPHVEIVPVELTGRGRRIHEDLYDSVEELVEDVLHFVKDHIKRSDYALFGHSMGGMIVHELALKLKQEGMLLPVHLFLSGRGTPHPRKKEKRYHLMDDERFKDEVLKLGGTLTEFFDHPELMGIFLPLLKNDFKLSETNAIKEVVPLDIDITAFFGKEEDFTPEQCDGWKNYTTKYCNIHYFPGGHFFLHQEFKMMLNIISDVLAREGALPKRHTVKEGCVNS